MNPSEVFALAAPAVVAGFAWTARIRHWGRRDLIGLQTYIAVTHTAVAVYRLAVELQLRDWALGGTQWIYFIRAGNNLVMGILACASGMALYTMWEWTRHGGRWE